MSVKRSAVLLNTEAHRPARDRFVEHLNQATRREGWRCHEAITYWLDAAFRAMRGATLKLLAPDDFAKNEAEYMRIVKRCRHPQETMKDLAEMMSALVLAMEAEPIDFVGPIFGEFAGSAELGQFFTPWHVSRLMAEMIIEDPQKMLADSSRGFITLSEPACGVGGMALAACAVLRERGFDLARQVHWTMVDIDYAAQCAAYVQMNLCGVSAAVFHGNTLSLDTWLATRTLAAILHPKHVNYDPKAALPAPPPEPASKASAAPPRSKPVQLSLFEV